MLAWRDYPTFIHFLCFSHARGISSVAIHLPSQRSHALANRGPRNILMVPKGLIQDRKYSLALLDMRSTSYRLSACSRSGLMGRRGSSQAKSPPCRSACPTFHSLLLNPTAAWPRHGSNPATSDQSQQRQLRSSCDNWEGDRVVPQLKELDRGSLSSSCPTRSTSVLSDQHASSLGQRTTRFSGELARSLWRARV